MRNMQRPVSAGVSQSDKRKEGDLYDETDRS